MIYLIFHCNFLTVFWSLADLKDVSIANPSRPMDGTTIRPLYNAFWNLDSFSTWRSTEKEGELERRRGKESFFFPINEAASREYRKHAVYSFTSGSRRGGGRPRNEIPLRILNTGDPYTRDNPGLKYLNQSLVVFIINFHSTRLRLTQVP